MLLATRGQHRFFEEERRFIRDAREVPIKFSGYAVSYQSGHPHVRIEQRKYLELKALLADSAVHRPKEWFEEQLRRLPFEPYAPVRGQLYGIFLEINRQREQARFEAVPCSAVRVRRRVVRPFEPLTNVTDLAAA